MKKFLALTLALLMALSLVACGSQPAADDNQDADNTPADTSNYVKTDYNPRNRTGTSKRISTAAV